MKQIGFVAVAAVVGAIASAFLPVPPGPSPIITFIGALAAIVGAIIGVIVSKQRDWFVIVTAIAALVVAVISLIQFLGIANGPPGPGAAVALYCWTCGIFLPVGLLIELSGLKWTP